MFKMKFILSLISLFLALNLLSEVKETHQIIEEWIDAELLISEESTNWKSEKTFLLDRKNSLSKELVELDEKMRLFIEEDSGAALQREELMIRKKKAESDILAMNGKIENIQNQVEKILGYLPSPLFQRLSPIQEKLIMNQELDKNSLRQRVELTVSLLQAIHIFHRKVTLERQEFTLDDGKSREFQVLYFGLSCAYFINDSGTISGYGIPDEKGWKWTRKDEIASEVKTGVEMVNNRTMPKFLSLPLLSPEIIDK